MVSRGQTSQFLRVPLISILVIRVTVINIRNLVMCLELALLLTEDVCCY